MFQIQKIWEDLLVFLAIQAQKPFTIGSKCTYDEIIPGGCIKSNNKLNKFNIKYTLGGGFTSWTTTSLMLEDWINSGGKAGDVFFSNFVITNSECLIAECTKCGIYFY